MLNLDLRNFKWQKKLNQIIMEWPSAFPSSVCVLSDTGVTRVYNHLDLADPRFDSDHWDGEQMVYRTKEPTNYAEYLILYHGS